MLSKVKSMVLNWLSGNIDEIQTNISNGIPEFEIVGLPNIVKKPKFNKITSYTKCRTSEYIRKRVNFVRNIQKENIEYKHIAEVIQ